MADKIGPAKSTLRKNEVAKPIHIQRLEKALDIKPLMTYMEQILGTEEKEDTDSESEGRLTENEMSKGDRLIYGVVTTKDERRSDRLRLFNFSSMGSEREWLRRTLLSSSSGSDSSDESDNNDDDAMRKDKHIKAMLKEHALHKKYTVKYYTNPDHARYMYYGAGLLSNQDHYQERKVIHSSLPGSTGRGRKRGSGERGRGHRVRKVKVGDNGQVTAEGNDATDGVVDWEERINHSLINQDKSTENDFVQNYANSKAAARARKKAIAAKSPEALTARRRRHWQTMAKKELGKVQRSRAATHRDVQLNRKRLATLCCKHWRHKAMQSQKNMKETIWRCKRLTREMQAYWRRYDRAERETRRRMERQAEEQRKMDVELMEAKRQRRKLNFLITQTELYAHFMQRKLGVAGVVGEDHHDAHYILRQLDEDRDPRLAAIDHYDSEAMKQKASRNARSALQAEKARAKQFDEAAGRGDGGDGGDLPPGGDHPQPDIFRGTLKGYQLKGMNWLANLYDQGISGILADEMGLGKTVQCIAFLCHVAEKLGVWGPFLVVSPASTLHNWQQEMQRFAPDFKVVPYWGSPSERRILRQFWERKDLHTRTAAFHVVVTSYQIVVSDLKYLNRVSWQYMILDEAQAIKSSASIRWKLLLGFSCRNRLLLSGTPIQNSMAELWALLHFIMPTLFDSHDEFNEWFSKDIESHAENKTAIDEKHLSRLHMILKPFMLRRIKQDVESELSDKIEIMVHCPLTIRQKLLYIALKKKIKIEELLHYSVGGESGHSVDKNFTSNLMNLVMQFRKVCNHPELFERRDVRSPFAMACDDYHVPVLIAERGILCRALPSKQHILYNKLSLFAVEEIQRSLFGTEASGSGMFEFSRFVGMSPADLHGIALCGWLYVLLHLKACREQYEKLHHRRVWWQRSNPEDCIKVEPGQEDNSDSAYDYQAPTRHMLLCVDGATLHTNYQRESVWGELIFTKPVWTQPGNATYTHTEHVIHYTTETTEHRGLRERARHRNTQYPGRGRRRPTHPPLQKHDIKIDIKMEPGEENPWEPEELEVSNVEKLSEFVHVERAPITRYLQPTGLPAFLYYPTIKAQAGSRQLYASSRANAYNNIRHTHCDNPLGWHTISSAMAEARPFAGWSNLVVPDKNQLVSDAGKLTVLDSLLRRLKERGHRVLIYSQMTKMIDLLEEYMWHRKHKYMRLDGSSKISARRDMVADFQARSDIFVFLLSTRAGGLGINLTAADTVIFYDSDWNPTVDQQAMDRAHRLGQTKQVTVYRLICKGTIEERIMERAREKSEIQRMVISGGNFKPDTLKPTEVVSLLLDDEEIELKFRQKSQETKVQDDKPSWDRKRKSGQPPKVIEQKRPALGPAHESDSPLDSSFAPSPAPASGEAGLDSSEPDDSAEPLVVDVDGPHTNTSFASSPSAFTSSPSIVPSSLGIRRRPIRGSGGSRRGRPRGTRLNRGTRPPPPSPQPALTSRSDIAVDEGAIEVDVGGMDTDALAQGAALLLCTDAPMESPSPRSQCRRGPGRPRLRSGTPRPLATCRRPRRPREPLLVPLHAAHQHSAPRAAPGPGPT